MKADLIITNANLRARGESAGAWAVACADGAITAVGTNDDIRRLAGPATERIDAGGCLVLPGFTDSHIHFLLYAQFRKRTSLLGIERRDEAVRRAGRAVRDAGPGEWVLGWGWNDGAWTEKPDARALDAVSGETPVALARIDLHSWWVNSAALRAAGITRDTPDPPAGGIERDEAGEPTGVLREWDAIDLVARVVPVESEEERRSAVRGAIEELHTFGVTGIHDLRLEKDGLESLRLFRDMEANGEFALRALVHLTPAQLEAPEARGAQDARDTGSRVRVGPVKVFADGSLGSRTASMIEPYDGEPGNRGTIVTSRDALLALARAAGQYDRSLSVHAIGDQAVRDVLGALEDVIRERARSNAPPLSMPHRIEHAQLVHANDFPRFADPRIIASVQPAHLMTDWRAADRSWGDRARNAYAFRSLLDGGARLAFGSDAPVASPNPLHGIHAAVTRSDERHEPGGGWYPEQKLTVMEAVDGYTAGPALAAGRSDLGEIAPGKRADLIVLSDDLFTIPADRILETRIVKTVFDGRLVYEAD